MTELCGPGSRVALRPRGEGTRAHIGGAGHTQSLPYHCFSPLRGRALWGAWAPWDLTRVQTLLYWDQ